MIRNEKVGSKELLADAMFHAAALGANEKIVDLKPSVEEVMAALEEVRRGRGIATHFCWLLVRTPPPVPLGPPPP